MRFFAYAQNDNEVVQDDMHKAKEIFFGFCDSSGWSPQNEKIYSNDRGFACFIQILQQHFYF